MSGRNLQTRISDFGSELFQWVKVNPIATFLTIAVIFGVIVVATREGFKAMKGKVYAPYPHDREQEQMSFKDMFISLLPNKVVELVSPGKIGTVTKEKKKEKKKEPVEEVILEEPVEEVILEEQDSASLVEAFGRR